MLIMLLLLLTSYSSNKNGSIYSSNFVVIYSEKKKKVCGDLEKLKIIHLNTITSIRWYKKCQARRIL